MPVLGIAVEAAWQRLDRTGVDRLAQRAVKAAVVPVLGSGQALQGITMQYPKRLQGVGESPDLGLEDGLFVSAQTNSVGAFHDLTTVSYPFCSDHYRRPYAR